jgi:hypothetical protein
MHAKANRQNNQEAFHKVVQNYVLPGKRMLRKQAARHFSPPE